MTPLDRGRLARVLGLLGSAHDGEVLAAARAAEQLRSLANATWGELLGAEPADEAHDLIISCLDEADLLTPWEIEFLRSLRGFSDPTDKQLAVLQRIALKVGLR